MSRPGNARLTDAGALTLARADSLIHRQNTRITSRSQTAVLETRPVPRLALGLAVSLARVSTPAYQRRPSDWP